MSRRRTRGSAGTAGTGENAPPRSLLGRDYRMPAEWERHAATWLAWPHNTRDWPGKFDAIPWVYTEVVRHLIAGERVEILVQDGAVRAAARRMLADAGVDLERVGFHTVVTDRSWTRDTLPTFVKRGRQTALVNWRFNGWAKYRNHGRDARIGEALAERLGLPRILPRHPVSRSRKRVVLEGGAIDVDGQGLLLTTEECLLSRVQQRNPGLGRKKMEQVLAEQLGARKVLWLGKGIAGDDTHGHVDDLARFVAPGTVITCVESRRGDANYRPLVENLKRLGKMTDLDGRTLKVHTLPMPRPLHFRGVRLPASYANFYIANAAVLVPTFNDPADRHALDLLAQLFPGREVVGISAVDLVWGLGTLHCMTQQQPA